MRRGPSGSIVLKRIVIDFIATLWRIYKCIRPVRKVRSLV